MKMKKAIFDKIENYNKEAIKHNFNYFKLVNRMITITAVIVIVSTLLVISSSLIKDNLKFKIRDYFYYNHNYNSEQHDTLFIKPQIKEFLNYFLYKNFFKQTDDFKLLNEKTKKLFIPPYLQVEDYKKLENKFINSTGYKILFIKKIDGAFLNPKNVSPYIVLNLDNTYKMRIEVNYNNYKEPKIYDVVFKFIDIINFYKNIKIITVKENKIYENLKYIQRYLTTLTPAQIYQTILPYNPDLFIGIIPQQLIPQTVKYDKLTGLYYVLIKIKNTDNHLKVLLKLDKKRNIHILSVTGTKRGTL